MKNQPIGRPMEILLIEDSLLDAQVAIAALRNGQVKHRLTLVRDGEEAMTFVRREGQFVHAPRPDIILLDLHLPKKDGLEVLQELKSDFHLRSIPVVILTASDDERDQQQCEHLEVDSYIRKPVNLEKFLDVIRQLKRYLLADVILPSVE